MITFRRWRSQTRLVGLTAEEEAALIVMYTVFVTPRTARATILKNRK